MKNFGLKALSVALLAATIQAGADHDVMQVKNPFVVKYPLGPSMEVQGEQPAGQSTSYRDSRNTNTPLYNRQCFSCSTGSFGSADYGSSGSSYSSGSGYRPGSFPASGSYVAPQSTSSRHEVRREQKYVNGQPIYNLHHERRFQDGSLVHDEKVEKDEDDFGAPKGSSAALGNQVSGSNYQWYSQPAYSKSWEEAQHENYTYGYGYGGGHGVQNQGSEEFSSNFNAEVTRLREQLHRQMGTHNTQILPATAGSSHRTEVHSQTRYVNGQPVYVRKDEKKYQDGRLIHNETEEKGAAELGNADLERLYDSSGAYIPGGYYNQRQQYHQESSRAGSSQYPSATFYKGIQGPVWEASHVQSGSHTPASSARQPTVPTYRPVSRSSSEYSQEHHRYSSVPSYSTNYDGASVESQHRNGAPSSYPSHRDVPNQSSTYYSQRKGEQSSSYPSYRPVSASSTTHSREESYSRSSSSQTQRPDQVGSSAQHTQASRDSLSPYPSYRPSSSAGSQYSQNSLENSSSYSSQRQVPSSTSQDHRTPTREGTSSYPSYRPVSGSSTQVTQESQENTHRVSSSYPSYRPKSGSYSPSYPSYRPSEERQTRHFDERYLSSSSSSDGSLTDDQDESSSEDLEKTQVLQNAPDSSVGRGATYTTQVNLNALNQESSGDSDYYYRQPRPDDSRKVGISSSQSTSENRHRSWATGNHGYPSSGAISDGGARTDALDLTSSTRTGSTLTDRLLGVNQVDQQYSGKSDNSEEYEEDSASIRAREHSSSQSLAQHSGIRQQSSHSESQRIGIPGVISGPHNSQGDGNYDNKERYDISPLDDSSLQLPQVGNEIDSSLIPTMPTVVGEVESGDWIPRYPVDSSNQHSGSDNESNEIDEDQHSSGPHRSRAISASESSQSSYHYNNTHTRYGTPINQYPSAADHSYDYSRSSSTDESQRAYPAPAGSHRYHYNETRRHSTIIGGQQNPLPAVSVGSSTLTSDCTQVSGCSPGSVTSSSRRSEIRTSKRYINGQLVGITHYERQYENGKLVHENVTEQGVDELSPQELQRYGIDQLNLVQGSYQPESYSQRHEVRQEKKYVNGQQTYDLHHERRFEDGQLVHDNRTEKDEDDFGVPSSHTGYPGAGISTSYYDGANRHEVTQSQHLQQHVTSDSLPGSVGRSSQTNQVSDTARVITKPVYTTKRHETRRQQEYINGQPVYDLHHERRFHNGSLVFENRTELDEKDIGGSPGGHYDALHQIMSGNTLNTASESTYRQTSGASAGGSSYAAGSYGGSSAAQNGGYYQGSSGTSERGSYHGSSSVLGSGTYQGSSALPSSSTSERAQTYGTSGSAGGALLTSGGSSLKHSGGARTTILGGSLGTGSARGGSTSTQYGSSSTGGTLLTSGESSLTHSGGARTTVLGGSLGTGSARGGSTSTQYGSSSSGGALLTSGESSLKHSGGARTTVLGGSLGTGSAGGGSTSTQYGSSSYEASQQSSSASGGCLTCVLLGGTGYSSQGSGATQGASHGYSGTVGGAGLTDGYSQRREMNREEYYEDGQLVHGREEDRKYEDGRLIQENRRQYSDRPRQFPNAEEFQSAGTAYTSRGTSGSSSSAVSSSFSKEAQDFGARVTVRGDTTGVCDPSPCHNGGTCVSGLRGPICVCTFGFKGTRCEEVYCPKRFCRFDGECSVAEGRHECSCKSGFSGPRCQTRSRRHALKP